MANLTLKSIPQELLAAKAAAVKSYFSSEQAEMPTTFAARPKPQHNVVGIGIGRKSVKGKLTSKRVVRFYVEKKLPIPAISAEFMLPARIGNVPTDVIETGRFRALAGQPPEQRRQRPAQPGCSIGFAFPIAGSDAGNVMAGTFGVVVTAGGTQYVLSNNHVLADENGLPIGSIIYQPGLLDKNDPQNDQIAKLTKFVTLNAGGQNRVDCAIAEVLNAGLVDPTVMPRVGQLSSGNPVPAADGMIVEKTGRTTGYTSGTIVDVSATVKIQYDLGVLTFVDQIIIVGTGRPFSAAGDSGSLIVEKKSKRPVGLLFGGSATHTIANHIEDVLQQLKVEIVAQTARSKIARGRGSAKGRRSGTTRRAR